MGNIYFNKKQYGKAHRKFKKSLLLKPTQERVYHMLSYVEVHKAYGLHNNEYSDEQSFIDENCEDIGVDSDDEFMYKYTGDDNNTEQQCQQQQQKQQKQKSKQQDNNNDTQMVAIIETITSNNSNNLLNNNNNNTATTPTSVEPIVRPKLTQQRIDELSHECGNKAIEYFNIGIYNSIEDSAISYLKEHKATYLEHLATFKVVDQHPEYSSWYDNRFKRMTRQNLWNQLGWHLSLQYQQYVPEMRKGHYRVETVANVIIITHNTIKYK